LLFILCVHFRPYIIDLDSINGTFLNNQKIDPRRFYELKEKVSMLIHESLYVVTIKRAGGRRAGSGRDKERSGLGGMRSSGRNEVFKTVLAGSPVLSFSLPDPARR